MDTVYALLAVAAIVGFAILYRKGVRAASKAINRKVLFKPEYEEGVNLRKRLTLTTSASVPDIVRELDAHVTRAAELPIAVKGVIYESSRTADRVYYSFGNKVMPKSFETVVMFTNQDGKTQATFMVLRWKEQSGIMLGQDALKTLRREVRAAFTAIHDAAVAEATEPALQVPDGAAAAAES
jgi:hypothetical protein